MGEIDEDRNEPPTFFSIAFYSPNFIPKSMNMALKDIEPIVGDGSLHIDPMESKRAKILMMMKWDDVMKQFAGAEWNPIKSSEFMGKPFGSHKIKVTPSNTSDMYFRWSKGYTGIYPFQGIHLVHSTEDSYQLRHMRQKEVDYGNTKTGCNSKKQTLERKLHVRLSLIFCFSSFFPLVKGNHSGCII